VASFLWGYLSSSQYLNPDEIPPYGRNDRPLYVGDDVGEGGGTTAAFSYNTHLKGRPSFRTK